MKIAGGVLGLIGGLIALMIGGVGYGLSSAGNDLNQMAGGGAIFSWFQYMAVVVPFVALLGAGIAFGKPQLGAAIMAGAAVLMIFVFGLHTVSLIPVCLLALGAILAWMDAAGAPSGNAPGGRPL